MISGNVFNNNSGSMGYGGNPQPITANGNYCAINVGLGNNFNVPNVIDSVAYLIITGPGVTAGGVSVQILRPDGVWVTATTPNSATGAAFTLIATLAASTTYNGSLVVPGSIFTPAHGIRLAVAGLTGGNITYAHLLGTLR